MIVENFCPTFTADLMVRFAVSYGTHNGNLRLDF
jgi:hypothetical protein